jgi:hypothetical protein
MMIIGVDYHPSFQRMAFLIEETGEYNERRLNHSDGEAEKYYRELKAARSQGAKGSSDCWQSWVLKCGSAIPQRSRPSASRSKRLTAKMRNCY